MQEMRVLSLGQEDPMEKEMATHSSILAGEIPRAKEPGGLQSLGSQRVRHDWVTEHASYILTVVHSVQFSSVAQSCPTLRPHELQHARHPCPSPTPGVHSNSCPLSRWHHPAISSSVVPFSSCPQSLPASATFPVSQLFTSGGQSIGVSASASVLPMNTQDWSPSGWTNMTEVT